MKRAIIRGAPLAFTPDSRLLKEGCRISECATRFSRDVFDRDSRTRMDAQRALQLPWWQANRGANWEPLYGADSPDHRPVLRSAEKSGAFTRNIMPESKEPQCDTEVELLALQAKFHPTTRKFLEVNVVKTGGQGQGRACGSPDKGAALCTLSPPKPDAIASRSTDLPSTSVSEQTQSETCSNMRQAVEEECLSV